METKDLMIGDWVMYKNEPIMVWEIDDYYYRINTEPDGYNAITCVEISEVTPIPLMPEILEKNGFHHSMPHNDWTNDNVDLILVEYGNGWNVQNTSIVLTYVHQLQHALRLCGVDKEIEL